MFLLHKFKVLVNHPKVPTPSDAHIFSLIGMISLHTGGVRGCCFSLDGNLLASASDDATVKVWEVGSLKCITTIATQAEG